MIAAKAERCRVIEQDPGNHRLRKSVIEGIAAERFNGGALIGALESILGQTIGDLLLMPDNQVDIERHLRYSILGEILG